MAKKPEIWSNTLGVQLVVRRHTYNGYWYARYLGDHITISFHYAGPYVTRRELREKLTEQEWKRIL